MFKTACLLLILHLIDAFGPAQATSIWGDGGFHRFSASLPHADPIRMEQSLGRDWRQVITRCGLEPSRIQKADWPHIDAVLQHSVQAKLGILELFTSLELADPKAPALILDEALLQRLRRAAAESGMGVEHRQQRQRDERNERERNSPQHLVLRLQPRRYAAIDRP